MSSVLPPSAGLVTFDPSPGLIGGGDDTRAGGHQGGAAVGVRDGRRGQFAERDQARLGVAGLA
jgi:hypothetical protein